MLLGMDPTAAKGAGMLLHGALVKCFCADAEMGSLLGQLEFGRAFLQRVGGPLCEEKVAADLDGAADALLHDPATMAAAIFDSAAGQLLQTQAKRDSAEGGDGTVHHRLAIAAAKAAEMSRLDLVTPAAVSKTEQRDVRARQVINFAKQPIAKMSFADSGNVRPVEACLLCVDPANTPVGVLRRLTFEPRLPATVSNMRETVKDIRRKRDELLRQVHKDRLDYLRGKQKGPDRSPEQDDHAE